MFSEKKKIFFRFEKRSDGKFDYELLVVIIILHLGALIGSYFIFSGKCEKATYYWSKLKFNLKC